MIKSDTHAYTTIDPELAEKARAEHYGVTLEALQGYGLADEAAEPSPGKLICKVCFMIYDPTVVGDPEPELLAS